MLITYDGISLPYNENTKFTQEVVYDEFSKTDAVAVKFIVETTFVLSTHFLQLLAPKIFEASDAAQLSYNAADLVVALGYRLRRPRRAFSLKFGATELVPSPEGAGTVDADNGPKPIHFKYNQLTPEAFVCEYKIEATYVDTRRVGDSKIDVVQKADNAGGGVLFHRWEESVSIDDCQYTKRTRKGRLTIRSDNPDAITPDKLRDDMVVLSVPDGWVRESSEYAVSSNGLSLDYTVTDRELYEKLPKGAYKAEGYYKESGRGWNSALRFAECYVRLHGSATTSQFELLLTAIRIVGVKLDQAGAKIGQAIKPGAIAQQVEAKVDLYNNIVEYRIAARYTSGKRQIKKLSVLRDAILQPPTGGQASKPYNVRGTSKLFLQAASYWDPLLDDHNLTKGKLFEKNDEPVRINNDRVKQPGKQPGELGKNKED